MLFMIGMIFIINDKGLGILGMSGGTYAACKWSIASFAVDVSLIIDIIICDLIS